MILNHQYRFIFIKTRKVGGTSLEIALSRFCGPDDIVTPIFREDEQVRGGLGYQGPANCWKQSMFDWNPRDFWKLLRRRKFPLRFYNHMSAQEIAQQVSPEIWDTYHKFTVSRNTWERVISSYFWSQRFRPELGELNIDEFLKHRSNHPPSENWHQITEDDNLLVDQVIRYEALEADLTELSARLGLPENVWDLMRNIKAKSADRAKAGGGRRTIAWTQDAIDFIGRDAEAEIRTFGYEPPSIAS